jgi:hypothetical protein
MGRFDAICHVRLVVLIIERYIQSKEDLEEDFC